MLIQGYSMKSTLLITICFTLLSVVKTEAIEVKTSNYTSENDLTVALQQKEWIHGSPDCTSNDDPAIEVFQYDDSSYVLRQNKCLSYEAPFIYVLVGSEKTLVLDTGATEDPNEFPIYETVLSLHQKHNISGDNRDRQILVIHSHSHSDHYGADSQFVGQPNVTVVSPNKAGIDSFFAFKKWPEEESQLELGGRSVSIIPTPGHQEEAIAVYDTQTKWLLTGDTFYPGYIYVKEWQDYKNSIARLVSFTNNFPVSTILGSHIEMTDTPGKFYDVGTIFQPNEASLVLTHRDLVALNTKLQATSKPQKILLDGVIVEPLSVLPKLLSNIARWFTQ
ncbi:MAG: hydroxyacylglutathione hydrolase [Colwellia sp.]|jgi:hydroxyacylglutathione hydrolase